MCGCLTQVAPQLSRRIWIIGSCAGALEFHLPDKAWCFPLFLLFCPEEQVFFLCVSCFSPLFRRRGKYWTNLLGAWSGFRVFTSAQASVRLPYAGKRVRVLPFRTVPAYGILSRTGISDIDPMKGLRLS